MNFVEVCAGCGGLSSGLVSAGFTPLILNDIDKDACATLAANHGEGVDIRCCSMNDLDLSSFSGKVDLLAGGVPCQSFSYAGKQKGLDDPRGCLFLRFIQLIKDCRPKMFLIENVKGLTSNKKGDTFHGILNMLALNGGYSVSYRVLNAKYFGVPQHRERVFIIGVRSDISSTPFIFPTEDHTALIPLRIALKDVPDSEGFEYNNKKKVLFAQIPQGGCWINLPPETQLAYLGAKTMGSGGGKRGILRRLHMDHPSLTLLCTPSQKQTERCHPLEDRPLRIREYARIQTFPDDYVFCGSVSSRYRQIGNAVPVELARRVGVAIRDFLFSLSLPN